MGVKAHRGFESPPLRSVRTTFHNLFYYKVLEFVVAIDTVNCVKTVPISSRQMMIKPLDV
jgi:hypothetical protein